MPVKDSVFSYRLPVISYPSVLDVETKQHERFDYPSLDLNRYFLCKKPSSYLERLSSGLPFYKKKYAFASLFLNERERENETKEGRKMKKKSGH